jgi:uncharacterized membrane protein
MNNLLTISIILLFSTIVGAFGAVFLKLGSRRLHVSLTLHALGTLVKNGKLMLGIFLYAGASIFFIISLKLGDLSIVYPMTSMGYIFITILSAWILKERINVYKIVGIACIIAGVILVTL